MEPIIRKGTMDDLDELERLYDGLNDYLTSGINYQGWQKGIYPIREDAKAGIRNNSLYVATIGEVIAGTVILNHEPDKAYHGVMWGTEDNYKNIYVVHTFAVHPQFIKRGIGKTLLNYCVGLAKKDHMRAIRLDVYEKNEPAIHLYEKCGFRYVASVDLGYGKYGLDWYKLYEMLF